MNNLVNDFKPPMTTITTGDICDICRYHNDVVIYKAKPVKYTMSCRTVSNSAQRQLRTADTYTHNREQCILRRAGRSVYLGPSPAEKSLVRELLAVYSIRVYTSTIIMRINFRKSPS